MVLTPPAATAADAARCASFIHTLPDVLDGRSARPTTPTSDLDAAWGRPAITLRCGLPPVAHPIGLNEFEVPEPPGVAGLTWFEDPVDLNLWTTRERPQLAVELPTGASLGDVLSDITDVLRGRPVGS